MISVRRAALLGLDAPLSPIMAAVLGLWPEEDETGSGYVIFHATGPARRSARQAARTRLSLLEADAALIEQAAERDMREAQEVIAALFALEGVF